MLRFGKIRAERMVVGEVISEKHQISSVILNRQKLKKKKKRKKEGKKEKRERKKEKGKKREGKKRERKMEKEGGEEKRKKKGGRRKKKGVGRTTPKSNFIFFPGYSTSSCLSEQATNVSLCICPLITTQLLRTQVRYESALAVSARPAQTQLSALLTWRRRKLCLTLEAPHLTPKSCFPYSCLASFF